jgi:hypothetical protein
MIKQTKQKTHTRSGDKQYIPRLFIPSVAFALTTVLTCSFWAAGVVAVDDDDDESGGRVAEDDDAALPKVAIAACHDDVKSSYCMSVPVSCFFKRGCK